MKPSQFSHHVFNKMPDNTGHLAIYLSDNECTFAVASSSRVLVYYNQEFIQEEQELDFFYKEVFRKQQSILARNFQSTMIGIQSHAFTLLPDAVVVNDAQAMAILLGQDNIQLLTSPVYKIKSKIAYEYTVETENLLHQNLHNYNIEHCAKYIIDDMIHSDFHAKIILEHQYFSLAVQSDNELQLINRYDYETPEDVLYFTLLGLEDAGILPSDASISIQGGAQHEKVIETLQEYIKTVQFQFPKTDIILPTEFVKTSCNPYLLLLLSQ